MVGGGGELSRREAAATKRQQTDWDVDGWGTVSRRRVGPPS